MPDDSHTVDLLLEVEDLRKAYGALAAVGGISFSVKPGEVLGIIGPNGAGKTSLMNALCGTPRSDSGIIRFNGERIERLPPHKRTQLGIVRTFQRVDLFRDFSALGNVCAGYENRPAYGPLTAIFGIRRSKDRAHEADARALLETVGLSRALWDVPAARLGHGEQRVVELARAMAAKPRLLLMDEPTVGLRDDDVEVLGAWIRSQQESGVGIIIVSHDMRFILGRSDRVLAMHFGKELACGTPDEIRADRGVVAAYLGED